MIQYLRQGNPAASSCAGVGPASPDARRCFREAAGAGHQDVLLSSSDRGAARTWLDDSRPAPRRLGSAICRFSSGSWTTACACWSCPGRRVPIVVCDLYLSGRLVRRAAGQDGPGALPRAHAVQGDRAVSQGADRSARVHRGRAGQRRDRRGLHALLVHVPLGPLGAGAADRGRPDDAGASSTPTRSRPSGKVIGEERAREMESPQVRLDQTHQTIAYMKHPYRNPVLGWPEDVARIGVDDLRRLLPAPLPARRRGAGAGRRCRAGRGSGEDRGPFRIDRRGSRIAPARSCDEPPQIGPARVHAGRGRIACPAVCWAGTPCRAGIATARRSTCWPTC